MVFEISGKVALITGGASGIGLNYAKELLRNNAKGVVLADVNTELGQNSVEEIEAEFGENKAMFVETNVSDLEQFENAFKKAIEKYNQLDILFNNAGLLNDCYWGKEIAVNINGTIHGILLGLERYLPKYKSGSEAVIVNISSVTAIEPMSFIPVYSATKFAIHGLTLCFGLEEHYQRSKVRVIGLAPGATDTPLIRDASGRTLGSPYEKLLMEHLTGDEIMVQTPEEMAKGMISVLQKAQSGTLWVIEGGQPPYQFIMPHRNTMTKNAL